MGTPTQNGVVTVGNNETTLLWPDSLLGEFTKASESRISETTTVLVKMWLVPIWPTVGRGIKKVTNQPPIAGGPIGTFHQSSNQE